MDEFYCVFTADGGAIPRMEHAKRRSASTSLFLHRDHATPTHYVITLKTGFNGDFFILAV